MNFNPEFDKKTEEENNISRRDFIKKASMVTGGFLASPLLRMVKNTYPGGMENKNNYKKFINEQLKEIELIIKNNKCE